MCYGHYPKVDNEIYWGSNEFVGGCCDDESAR